MMQKLYTSCLLKSRENGHLTSMRACSFMCVTVRSRGLRFDSQLGSSCIATLDKLFKPLCLHQQSVNLAMLCSWEGDHSSGMHWQFVTDLSSLTSKPIKVTWVLHSHIIAEYILYLTCFFSMLCRCRCHSSNSKMSVCLAVDICVMQTDLCQTEHCWVSFKKFFLFLCLILAAVFMSGCTNVSLLWLSLNQPTFMYCYWLMYHMTCCCHDDTDYPVVKVNVLLS